MMKKTFLVALFAFVLVLSLSAGSSQKYYAVSSVEWQTVNTLCHTAGVAGPSSNGPVTASQLLYALERAGKYLDGDNAILAGIRAELQDDTSLYCDDIGSVNLSASLSPEAYVQTGSPYGDDSTLKPSWGLDSDWFLRDHLSRPSAVSLTLENTISDYVYSRFTFPYRQKVGDSSAYWNKNFSLSFLGSRPLQNFPIDAGVSFGAKGVSLIIARGKVSLGEGYTGNTGLGDNYDYQEFMKLGYYTRNTSVFLNLTSFDSSRNVDYPWQTGISKFSGYRNLRHSVVYEMVFCDRAKVSVGLISMLDTDTAFDFRYLNPFMILHSMYNFHETSVLEANNLITVDFSWSFLKKWNFYIQLSSDQVQITGEAKGYVEEMGYTDPNAFGGLVNISYSDVINNTGLLNVYAEFVYNMPGMYLNSKYYYKDGTVTQQKTDSRCWSQDYLVGYHREEEYGNSDINYSGYKYGPDCLVVSLGGTWRVPDSWSVSSSVLYMAHGEKGRGTDVKNYTFEGIDTVDDVWRLALTGTVEHTLVLKAEGEVALWKYLSLSLGAAYSYRWNYRNTEGKTFSNLQAYVGFTLSWPGVSV